MAESHVCHSGVTGTKTRTQIFPYLTNLNFTNEHKTSNIQAAYQLKVLGQHLRLDIDTTLIGLHVYTGRTKNLVFLAIAQCQL